jgi:hypothetical protein
LVLGWLGFIVWVWVLVRFVMGWLDVHGGFVLVWLGFFVWWGVFVVVIRLWKWLGRSDLREEPAGNRGQQ